MDGLVTTQIIRQLKGRRVLVTGDTGFKGSWLALWLHVLGADVTGYALPPRDKEGHFDLLGLRSFIRHVDGDIRDQSGVQKVFDDSQPEVVFHLAAQALVRESYRDPKFTFDTNIGGSVNILEAVRASRSVKSLVYITSDKCYRNNEWTWGYRENDELRGEDPYSASKAAAELIFHSYLKSFFAKKSDVGLASVRAGNVIGGGDWSMDRIVPDSIRSLKASQPIVLRNPHATRPWQHVLEPLSGYLLLAVRLLQEPTKHSGAWNFGPRVESIKTVRDVAETIIKCWGEGSIEIQSDPHAPHESGLLLLNCDKANQALNWFPRWCFDKAISETVYWYRHVLSGSPALSISREQIERYTDKEASQ